MADFKKTKKTCQWVKYDPETAPRNIEVMVTNKETGARAAVTIRGNEGPCNHRGYLPWVPTHILVFPVDLP